MKLLSYHNDAKLKRRFVKEIRIHTEADAFIQGHYGEINGAFKGCAVGCSIESFNRINGTTFETNDHKSYESAIGVPEWLARLEDAIFEGLKKEEAKLWPLAFSKAVPIGADLEPVKRAFCSFLMSENIERVNGLSIDGDLKKQVIAVIEGVKKLHDVAANAVRSAAWSAARSAAGNAAGSAAGNAAGSAAGSAANTKYAAKLIELLIKQS